MRAAPARFVTPPPDSSADRGLAGRWGQTCIGSRTKLSIHHLTTTRNCPSVSWDQPPAGRAAIAQELQQSTLALLLGGMSRCCRGERCLCFPLIT